MGSATLERPAAVSSPRVRRWHPVARAPLPAAEAGRAHLCALLNGPGGPRCGLKTAGDDRAETSLKAAYRYLWRLAHAQRSGAYASTQDQLVAGLMPVMGWADKGSVEENRSAHGRTVRRWLDRLQAMGLLTWSGVRDNRGQWWRIEITLLPAPAPDSRALRAARRRLRGFARRERRRRAVNPTRRRDLGQVLARSGRPCAPTRRSLARTRARAVEAARGARRPACVDHGKVRSNPFGAPPTVGEHLQFEPTPRDGRFAERTGAHAQLSWPPQPQASGPAPTSGTDTLGAVNGKSSIENEDFAELAVRVAAVEAAIAAGELPPTRHHGLAATRARSFEALLAWPADRPVPDRVLGEAFEHATGSDAKVSRDRRHRPALERALARYARWVEHRPTTSGQRWPQSPPAALAWAMRDLAGHTAHDGQPPASLAYAIGRLDLIARQMAAEARRDHADHELAARASRLERRRRRQATTRWTFRTTGGLRFAGATEAHRRHAIDQALEGRLPGFEALHGFLVRASDLLGRPNPHRHLPSGHPAYPDALNALRHLDPAAAEHRADPDPADENRP